MPSAKRRWYDHVNIKLKRSKMREQPTDPMEVDSVLDHLQTACKFLSAIGDTANIPILKGVASTASEAIAMAQVSTVFLMLRVIIHGWIRSVGSTGE